MRSILVSIISVVCTVAFVLVTQYNNDQEACKPAAVLEHELSKVPFNIMRRGLVDEHKVFEWWEGPNETFLIFERTASGNLCVIGGGLHAHTPGGNQKGEKS